MLTTASFGTWLKSRRREQDLTQQELAQKVYCAEITIRKIEADELRPSRELAELILRFLGVDGAEQANLIQLARRRRFPW